MEMPGPSSESPGIQKGENTVCQRCKLTSYDSPFFKAVQKGGSGSDGMESEKSDPTSYECPICGATQEGENAPDDTPVSTNQTSSDDADFKTIYRMMPCIGRGLYISGVGGVTSPKVLKSQNITHVLNVTQELQDISFPDFVSVSHAGIRDSEDEDLLRWLPELVEHIHLVISNGGRIVVNCVAGVSRSASVCLAYKVRHEDLSLREAFEEVHRARSVICPNLAFWKALIEWELEVRGEISVVMKPFICGMVPELESYEEFAQMRIRIGWMEELLIMWSFHLVLLCLQVVAIVWG